MTKDKIRKRVNAAIKTTETGDATLAVARIHPYLTELTSRVEEFKPEYQVRIYSLIALSLMATDNKNAIKTAKIALALDAESLFALTCLGKIYTHNNHLYSAHQVLNKAIRLNAKYVFALVERSDAHLKKGDVQLGFNDADDAIAIDGFHIGATVQRAIASMAKGIAGGMADYNDAIDSAAPSPHALTARAAFYRTRTIPEALELGLKDVNQSLKINPRDAYAAIIRGEIHRKIAETFAGKDRASQTKRKDFLSAAHRDLSYAIELEPTNSRAFISRSVVHELMRDLTKAIQDVTTAIALSPTSSDALNHRGHYHRENGDFDKALVDFSEAEKHNPDDIMAKTNIKEISELLKMQAEQSASAASPAAAAATPARKQGHKRRAHEPLAQTPPPKRVSQLKEQADDISQLRQELNRLHRPSKNERLNFVRHVAAGKHGVLHNTPIATTPDFDAASTLASLSHSHTSTP